MRDFDTHMAGRQGELPKNIELMVERSQNEENECKKLNLALSSKLQKGP